MVEAPKPADEAQRLQALRSLEILDTPAEYDYDRIVEMVTTLCEVPIGMVTLVDADRQWFRACRGLSVTQTSRDVSFCAHAILQDGVFEIPDTHLDPWFADNPLVTGEPHIRFYAGAVCRGPEGDALGTLCLIDHQPRRLTSAQRQLLEQSAAHVSLLLSLRAATQRIRALEAERRAEQEAARQAREAARRAMWAQSDALGHAAQMLRTPLNRLLGIAQALRTDPTLGEAPRALATELLDQGWALVAGVDELVRSASQEGEEGAAAEAPVLPGVPIPAPVVVQR